MATAVAEAAVKLFMDQDPLRHALGNLGNLLTSPLRDAARMANTVLGKSLADIGQSWKSLLHGNIGGAFAGLGNAVTDAMSGAVRAGSNLLGDLTGKAINVTGKLVAGLTEGVFKLAGNATKALGDLASTGGQMMANMVRGISGAVGDVLNFIPIIGPLLGGAVKIAGGALAAGVELVGNVIGGALALVGGMVTKIGSFVAGAIESLTRLASSAARTVIPLAGGIIGGIIDTVGHGLSSAVGNILNAITNPVKRALSRDLLDLNLGVQRLISKETDLVRFNAAFQNMGANTGFSRQQLDLLIESMVRMGGVSKGQAMEGIQALLKYDQVQGQVFRRLVELLPSAAQGGFGGNLAAAAEVLGRALNDPAMALHRLSREMGLFTRQEAAQIEQMAKSGNVAEAQAAILDKLSQRFGGMAQAMQQTVSGRLMLLARDWNKLGDMIAQPLMPLVSLVTDVARAIVGALGGAVSPILKDLTRTVGSWAKGISGFLDDNLASFQQWADLLKDIAGNVWNLVKQGVNQLFGNLDPAQAKDFWTAFRDGITDALKWLKQATSSWDNFRAAANQVWQEVPKLAEIAWKTIWDFAKSVWEDSLPAITKMWGWFSEKGKFVIGEIGDYLKEMIGDILATIGKSIRVGVEGEDGLLANLQGILGNNLEAAGLNLKAAAIMSSVNRGPLQLGVGGGKRGAAGGMIETSGGDFGENGPNRNFNAGPANAGVEHEEKFVPDEEGEFETHPIPGVFGAPGEQPKNKYTARPGAPIPGVFGAPGNLQEFLDQTDLKKVKGPGLQAPPFRFEYTGFAEFAKKLQENISPSGGGDPQKQVAEGIGKLPKKEDAKENADRVVAAIQEIDVGLA